MKSLDKTRRFHSTVEVISEQLLALYLISRSMKLENMQGNGRATLVFRAISRKPIISMVVAVLVLRQGRFSSFIRRYGSENNPRDRIVVAMTTIPSRIEFIKPTLTSIIENQTMAYDHFYLTLPMRSWKTMRPTNFVLPDFLKSYQAEGRITVLSPEFDYGPVGKMLYALKEHASEKDCRILYIDDDVIYDRDLIRNLTLKSDEYPNAAVAFSGTKLRNHFRQVKHRGKENDRHPNLFFPISGTSTFDGEVSLDIVQGFTGVVVRPRFFDCSEFFELVWGTMHNGSSVWKSDDVIISAYLEYRNVTRMLVSGGTFPILNEPAISNSEELSTQMMVHIMEAVYDLQHRLKIWQSYTFEDVKSFPKNILDLIRCEAKYDRFCKTCNSTRVGAIHLLDETLLALPAQT